MDESAGSASGGVFAVTDSDLGDKEEGIQDEGRIAHEWVNVQRDVRVFAENFWRPRWKLGILG